MTFIAFPNISAQSKNGSFRVEITGKSIDYFFRDQESFTYRLFHSERLAWEFRASKVQKGVAFLDDYPHEAWVSDEGWVVVRTHEWFRAGLLVISPDGMVALRRQYRRLIEGDEPGFLDSETEKYLSASSAGPCWARGAFAYFTNLAGRPIWVIRTWWGRRVAIDLTRAELLEPTELNDEMVRGIEIDWVESNLKAGEEIIERRGPSFPNWDDRDDVRLVSSVNTAAYHAGWLKAIRFVPYLERLEALETSENIGYISGNDAKVMAMPIRQVAKLSLLRMGVEPKWIPHYRLEPRNDAETDNPWRLESSAAHAPGHSSIIEHLKPGATQLETLHRIGCPDFISAYQWDYDSFAPEPAHTCRIIWDRPSPVEFRRGMRVTDVRESCRRIERMEKLEPQWNEITLRDQFLH